MPSKPEQSDADKLADEPTIQRVFLGLENPPLISAVEWLIQTCQTEQFGGQCLDLSEYLLVLPTLRSQQRLLQLLIRETTERGIDFIPPTITSLGKLPEYLYVAEKQLATDLAQQIAWSNALAATPEQEIKTLTGRSEVEDLQDWQPLATLISTLHTRLANDIWSFTSVAREVQSIKGFLQAESARWETLKEIQKRYYKILGEADLWDKQAARNYAAGGLLKRNEIRCQTDKSIVMIGTADLNLSVSEMLRQVAVQNSEQVRILIAAPETMAERFDAYGSLVTEAWLNVQIEIGDEQILYVDQPADQADATAHYITGLGSEFSADEISIGVPDLNSVPQLERAFNAIELNHRDLSGRQLSETGPVRLMAACRDFLENESYDAFAALVRHPDLFVWLCERVGGRLWLNLLDDFQNKSLPGRLPIEGQNHFGDPDELAKEVVPESQKRFLERRIESANQLNKIHVAVAELLLPLKADAKPIAEWTVPWSQILVEVYSNRLMDKTDRFDQQVIKACDAIYTALGNQNQVPKTFGAVTTAAQALDWAVEAASETRVVAPPITDAVEFVGWLDLPLDDAPVVVVTSMNDEHVPTSEIGHQFLPNELCKELNILDNDRRYARDAYALTVVAAVRERLLLVSCRRNESGEPKKPSRLLFATDATQSALRAKAFFSYTGNAEPDLWLTTRRDFPVEQQFPIPHAVCTKPLAKLAVTKFREYLKCPYRFYLGRVLRLEARSDDWRELSGGTFGDLAHNVLQDFGESDVKDSTNIERIRAYLNQRLDARVKSEFSGSRLPAVRIQVEQLRLRLERFAYAQSAWRKEGWKIVSTEEDLYHDFPIDGDVFVINGKIDRVDLNENDGRVAVLDYKSSDAGKDAFKTHYASGKKEWLDLQLPLYRHLVKEVDAVKDADLSNVLMGFILLPKKLDEVRFDVADFTPEQLFAADDKAKEVIRNIQSGKFWPPRKIPPIYSEDFAAICQDNAFERYVPVVESSSGDEWEGEMPF